MAYQLELQGQHSTMQFSYRESIHVGLAAMLDLLKEARGISSPVRVLVPDTSSSRNALAELANNPLPGVRAQPDMTSPTAQIIKYENIEVRVGVKLLLPAHTQTSQERDARQLYQSV